MSFSSPEKSKMNMNDQSPGIVQLTIQPSEIDAKEKTFQTNLDSIDAKSTLGISFRQFEKTYYQIH